MGIALGFPQRLGASEERLRDEREIFFFPQHLLEGLLNFRRRVFRLFWLDLAVQDPPRKRTNVIGFFCPPQGILTRKGDFLNRMP